MSDDGGGGDGSSDFSSDDDGIFGIANSRSLDEVQPLPLIRNPEDAEKLEEFQKLLRSMMDSRAGSLEDDEPLAIPPRPPPATASSPEQSQAAAAAAAEAAANSANNMESAPGDQRLDYLGAIVQKSLKLKPEKWGRLLMTEEYRNFVFDFLDNAVPAALFVVLTPNAQLVPSCGFPIPCQRTKGVYAIKMRIAPIPKDKEACASMLLTGDLSHRVVDELATIVDNIFAPLLCKVENHRDLPTVAVQDISRHVHSLRGTLYQVKGQVNGRTVLPMPAGLEKVSEVERTIIEEGPEAADLYLKSAIEGVVIKWAYLVNDVVTHESSAAFENGQNPTPYVELDYWSTRLANLRYIFEQLREDRVRKMAVILEKTDSAYYPCFKTLFSNVVSSLTEAKEISLYLSPLGKVFKQVEEIDFAEAKPIMASLIHMIGLAWSNSRYYQSSSKLIIMLRMVSNLLIQEARSFLDPSLIFQSDVDEAQQRVQISKDVLEEFKRQFDLHKNKPGLRDDVPVWTFNPSAVFGRLNAFLKRLNDIEWLFDTMLEFSKLEKIELGGTQGRSLSTRIMGVFKEFQQLFTAFTSRSTDVLEPDDQSFIQDCRKFAASIVDLDSKMAAILCQAFDDCNNLESAFKLINIAGSVLDRPVIRDQFTKRYGRIVELLKAEMSVVENLFDRGSLNLMTDLPPLAGALQYTSMLKQRIDLPVQAFKSLQHPVAESDEGKCILQRYETLYARLNDKQRVLFMEWVKAVPTYVDVGLNMPLLKKDQVSLLTLNFDQELFAILKEVNYLKQMCHDNIPKEALDVAEMSETFRKFRTLLTGTVTSYNDIRRTCRRVEFNLIEKEIARIDTLIERGQNELRWNSEGLLDYMTELNGLVQDLYCRVKLTQANVEKIRNIIEPWTKVPLIERKDRRKHALLSIEDRAEKVAKRYAEIRKAAEHIELLLAENKKLFEIKDDEDESWRAYVKYVDKIVVECLRKSVGCSLGYLAENMDPTSKNEPLLEARLELREPDLFFIPSLEPDDPDGLDQLLSSLLDDIIGMARLLPRLKADEDSYADELEKDEDINGMKTEILTAVAKAVEEASDFCGVFEGYSYLWLEDREVTMHQFLDYSRQLTMEEIEMITAFDPKAPSKNPPKMEQFREQIDLYESLYTEVEEISSSKIFCVWFRVDLRPFQQSLLNTICKWSSMFKKYLVERVTSSLSDLGAFIRLADEGLLQQVQPGDYTGLVSIMGFLMQVKERQPITDEMFQPLQETIELLKFYDQDIPEEVNVLLQELPDQWLNTKKLALTVKQQVAPLQAGEVARIRARISAFDTTIIQYREAFRRYGFFKYDCEDPYAQLDEAHKEITLLETQMRDIQESASLFEVLVPEFKQLKQCRKELKMLKQLWDYVNIVRSSIEGWKTTPWKKIDVENMDIESKKFAKEIRGLDKEMRPWDTYIMLEATVKNILTSLRAVGELQNPAIRERHWLQLMKSTKVEFVMDDATTLADLLELNLHDCEEEVKNIVDKAVKEMSMEKYLRELNVTWSGMEFEKEVHQRTGATLLRASEELIESLEENQVQLQNLITSKFIAHFLDEVSCWQKKLSIADQVTTIWFEVQRTWTHLESIFMSSEDIRKQLPVDAERFDRIDQQFKHMTHEMAKTPNVVEATNKEGLVGTLDILQKELVLCEKALAEYLETKRLAFPRFYFVSSSDLLDVLSNGNQPEIVAKHLIKLFDSMARLRFHEDNTKPEKIVGMFAKDGEYVEFTNFEMVCEGAVEVWLNRLQNAMRVSIRHYFQDAVIAYEDKPREQWLFDYPAQISLCGTQVWWTTELNAAFARLEEGYDNALKDYLKKQISQLSTLITLLLGELNKGDRQKIMTICTIDVHSRDVVAKLVQSKVETAQAFQWQSQLRHRWDEKEKDCFANICDAQFRYSHEYLGNTPRLVITPLTDRCYITLTQSLHLVMGGGPAGPAGTGKTETTKDLGRALGIMVYVFNCSEQMDYKSCGNIYKGLAQTGAWGCFDEFNRISVEVLSVVAVQVKSVQDAIKDKKTIFNFMGDMIKLTPSVGIFITMNPGYAGRTELPENLKALFRPCAMVVPDFELICEIMLVAEGFQDARVLARKFITLYTLCKELLSKQDHYDWGLRAIKSVLVVAGSLKRGDPGRPEEEVLMRALRDFNIPKVVSDDLPVFMGLIADLFPALDVPRKRDIEFEKTVKAAATDLFLQPEDGFILKVVQLEELLEVRHSVFIVGSAGCGKTQVWKTLFRTYQNIKRKPIFNDLNPKAVTNDELFGIINPATREWKDGLFSVLMRDQANLGGDNPKWIVLDGDIDPMWIESLNTVMDDNKVLTLASNERIALTPSMRLVFEISNLRTATPATVSRAGILYINPQDLGWNPYVTSWIETRSSPSEKSNLVILFDRYIPICLETVKVRFKKITPIANMAHIEMLCHLLTCLLTPELTMNEFSKDHYEIYFVFAAVWAFGSAMFQDQTIDHRVEFSKWWCNEFKQIKFPAQGTVFDYYIDPETKNFLPWTERLPKFELDADLPLQAVLVHTAESIRIRYFLDLLMEKKFPVMLVGPAGSGKTVSVAEKLLQLPENFTVTNVPFNFYTSSEMLQKILEKPLEKKAGRNYGPPGNKTMIYFIDDMNMPEVDAYGTVQPHTLIRQHLDYNHWYDRTKLTLKDIHNCQYVSCMNPTAGSFTINPRLQRHFAVFAVSFPNSESLTTIYASILSQHLANVEHRFPLIITEICGPIVQASLQLHHRCAQVFLPTATKFHYIFNLRDLSNCFQGLLFSGNECLQIPSDFVRLWMHETHRVYGDKLTDEKDIESFTKFQVDILKKNVEEIDESAIFEKPNIYCHFAGGVGEPKYMPVKDWPSLHRLLTEALVSYNDLVSAMNLVLFEDAMMHVCRINRILESPRGSALLVGVGGSGKQSLARLAAFISSLEVFQIQLRKGYGISDLKLELAALYSKSGLKNIGIMFLMTDAQVPNEHFLVLINDMLASGEIPDLFPEDEVENIIASVRNEVKGAGILDTRENCWKFFIDRVRRQLRIVLCFSPVGSTLRVRSRKFPAIINCTAINWFHEWPQEALMSVSKRFLQELVELPETYLESVAKFMAHAHTTVNSASKQYLASERRYNYTTPKSFLEQISLYTKLLRNKSKELKGRVERLENGLAKLRSTAVQVDDLKKKLAVQEIELQQKNEAADTLIAIVGVETEKVQKEKALADEEEAKVAMIAEEVSKKQKDCEADLLKAEPALVAAQEALNTLNKANLTELKSFGSPPGVVTNVTAAVMVLLAPNGKIPKDRSWKAAKITMAKVDAFLDALINYDKENIHPEVIKSIQPYLKDSEFEPDFVKTKSAAAAGLCAWVINIIKFYEVFCDVEPKRKALAQANAELAAAQEKLAGIKRKVASLEDQLAKLTADFEQATAEKLKCQQEADATNATIALANRLVGGLASENVRWADSVANLMQQASTLPGDVLLVTAFISYVGCFTKQFRLDLVNKQWLNFLRTVEPIVPITDGLDPLTLLTDDTQIAKWNNEGLPNDRMSTENATILTNSDRWPLMIDPQLQGIKWIKQKYGDTLNVIRLGQRGYLDVIEQSLAAGAIVLIENIGEHVDPVLDSLLGRNLIKKGKALKIGDKEVEYNSNFRLILHTKLANPHYKPEMQAQTTLINFTVTRDGLEDQLLAEVVKAERPDLEELKADLTRQQNDFKITLNSLEDSLLSKLSSAGANVLGDTALVENLETTKKTAAEIECKVTEARETSKEIDTAREFYRPAAARASLLYFILNDLNTINPIYQFSLKAFSVVFQKAVLKAVPAADVAGRVTNLIECITYSVFMYTSRGLFECDKLIFASQMAFQVLLAREEINVVELDFLLRFPITPHVTSPVDFLTNTSWGGIRSLASRDEFRNLDRDIETSSKRWKKLVECECPEREKFPQEWKNKSAIQRLCMLRALRPDRMTYAIAAFIEEKLGPRYVESRTVEFAKSFEETSPSTPIFFILSPGVNPLKDVEDLGRRLGFTSDAQNFHNVSLGQGQESVAEQAMDVASKKGHWVVLQNIHLVKKWLPLLEKKLEVASEGSHEDYRVFMSAEPASTPAGHIIPQGILESSIKITNEPPTGMQANLHKALDNFTQETLEMCSKEAEFKVILFSLCYFHAVVAERRKFGPQGWNKIYPFNVGDLNISVHVLHNYLEASAKIPWEDLRYLFGEIMYGGHITDDWDRRLCVSYLEELMQPDLVDGELQLAPGFLAPPNTDMVGFHTYIDEALPAESPYLYGLHPNAEVGFLTTSSENLFRTVFEMQPRDAGSSGGQTVTREDKVKQILDEILEKLPEEFNMVEIMGKVEERTPYVIVAFQECERMNYLTNEIKRSLRELDLGLKGELTITSDMEDLETALFLDQIPQTWTQRAYPSLLGLTAWFVDLLLRIRELESWSTDFVLPASVWLAGFFNPQSLLTAIMQSTARRHELPLDKMCLQCDVTKKNKEEFTTAPRDGAYVHGIFMEGARWDVSAGIIVDSRPKELFPAMPVINIRAITQDKQDLRNMYECPVYKTRTRGPTYVWTFNLKTKDKSAKWTLAGVALLLQT
ncbi:dynein beta chain, ciliary [Trichogramma pretiosum]|uniref:dynein beta chain, ciliary n=1 Tax=Trichogramma pretiosum TaxID=7493 RepID=UPI0006C9CBBC|nr:dynein beta chain, ciliary [Trichogramma pretiosum]